MKNIKTYEGFLDFFKKGGKSDEIKDMFLKLTEFTIPFEHEYKLEKYLPSGYKKDSVGNYYIQIGNSETLFTTHLDTYSKKYEKVKHVINGDIIKTDGKTILGGDNKLGMCILLYMIKRNIPGTYYFFLGEEPILSGGLWGSGNALESNPDFFKRFKRAVAFDRKQKGSVVTRQMAQQCCSDEFAEGLCKELSSNGISSNPDPKAYYTDTASFMGAIPECTNISAGGWDEHYPTEWVDLSYTRKVAEAACKVKWELLPTERVIKSYEDKEINPSRSINRKIIPEIKKILTKLGLLHTNVKEYETNNTETLVFNTWFEELNIRITVSDDILLQIEGYEDIRLKINEVSQLRLYLMQVFK